MTTRTALTIATALALSACQQAPAPDRHVLWSGTGIPLTRAAVVSTHDSKPACEAARDAHMAIIRQPDDTVGGPDEAGAIWYISRTRGVVHGLVCHPVGVNPG